MYLMITLSEVDAFQSLLHSQSTSDWPVMIKCESAKPRTYKMRK